MPRPKVHPSQRQRAAEACNFCRASKKRCSATVPCTACQRRGIGDSCYLTHRPRGSRRLPPRTRSSAPEQVPASPSGGDGVPDSLDASLDQLPQESAWGRDGFGQVVAPEWCPEGETASMDNEADADYQPLTPSDSRISMSDATTNRSAHPSTQLPARPGSPALEPESHARMLLNLRGERGKASYHHLSTLYMLNHDELIPASRIVYIGEAASLSFLQLIRDTVTAQIGPSQFSHNEKRDSMLETEPSAVDSNGLEPTNCNIDLEGSLLYARTFEAATGGLLDIFGPTEIEDILLKTGTDGVQSLNPCQHATVDLVIAIGAQCKSPMDAQQIGPAYFRQAQQRAFAGMLEDPNIDMVRAFLLMAFYMLGHCRRNTAFMYLGIASRAAVALGMHSPHSYTDLKNPSCQLRLHIWMSLCVLDMLVCSILGRPPATAGLRAELDTSIIASYQPLASRPDSRTASLFASYKILTIINESVDALYGRKVVSTGMVESLLNKIEDWSKSLPSFLRNPLTPKGSPSQRAATDSIHVACLYYFAITLVTRPILISRLTSRRDSATPSSSPMASACLDAAVYLVQTCSEAHKSGLLLGNMCILKALIFAAGLILGFDMFAKRELDYEVEVAFRSAKDVLDFLGIQSPQASHYSEILGLLSNAITKRPTEETLVKTTSPTTMRLCL
ncbi:transcriptional regulator family: Fungal Specific TF [Trichoderma aggressivum f. europaeum]|uniref:Transcriptional regulator family: Fungal Specific TF n=1 Tax=Trichoderma aggressivum f. europaeum TaxID=173218 RepID=A0AAE1IFU8_9HYPO|nr:transcriptional regulator family: Fungal Specific TF [Trichoderma aggressivum f. europaeum]